MSSRKIIVSLFLLGLISLSCKNNVTDPDFSYIKDPYMRWKAYGFQHYSIEQHPVCFCGLRPANVFVKDGIIIDVIRVSDSTSLSPSERSQFKTIDELFALIKNIHPESIAIFSVSYDSMFGYPTEIWVDPDAGVADEEYGYRNEKLVKRD